MGAGESRPSRMDASGESNRPTPEEQNQPKVLRIERSQIPDAYKNVGVSSEVIRRVSGSTTTDSDVSALNAELEKEREANAKLRGQMQNLTALQNRFASGQVLPQAQTETLEDVEEKKRVFDETVQRVEKQFFSYQRENACEDNEKELMECLSKNKGKVLNCKSLKVPYDECIVKFRHEVLSSKANNLAIYVQPLLAVFDDNGNRQNPEPSADFLELREIILKSRHQVENFAEACLVLPGIDTLSTNRFSDLLHLTHSLDSAASLFPSKPNFLIFNLYGFTSNFGDSIVVSPIHLNPKYRRYFDVAIPAKTFVKRNENLKVVPLLFDAILLLPQPYGSQFPSILTYNIQKYDSSSIIKVLTKCLKNLTCIDGKEIDYFSVLKAVDFVIINEESIGFDHILMHTLEAGAIPIFLSDLIVKPFEHFIDWSSLTFPPTKIEYMFKVIKEIEESEIIKRKNKIREIYAKHFASFSTVIQSALTLLEQRIIPTKVQPLAELFDCDNKNSYKPYIYATDYLIAAISHQKSTSDDKLKWMLRNFLYTQTNVSTILLVTEVSVEHIFEEFIVPSNPLQIEVLQVPSISQLPYLLQTFDSHSHALILDSSYPYTNIDEDIINMGFTAALTFPQRISYLISEDCSSKSSQCPAIFHTSHLPNIRVEFNLKNNNLCFPLSSKTGNNINNLTWISCPL
uniref:Uncharacterized protein n=1 Tax=Panagrolaimus sp. ES5 TaxID=591445 RepID=A0AC34GRV4_9BILA